MKVLLNISAEESRYNKAIEYLFGKAGINVVYTTKVLSITEAMGFASKVNAQAFLICNEQTLFNFVDDPKPTLNRWRGSRIDTKIPSIVIDKISNVYQTNEGEWLLQKDLKKIRYCRVPGVKFDYTVLTDTRMFSAALDILGQSLIIGGDIETQQWQIKRGTKKVPCYDPATLQINGLGETWITVVSFSGLMPDGKIKTFVLPLVNGMNDFWKTDEEYAAALLFLQMVMRSDIPKCFHNGLYDSFHLMRYHAAPNNWIFDTMGLSHSWYSELSKDVGFLCSWLLYDHKEWKYMADREHKAIGGIESYWKYAAYDTHMMMRALIELLKNGDTWMLRNYKKQFPLVYPSLYGAFEGFRVNNETRLKLVEKAEERLESALKDLRIMTDDPEFNPGSPDQVSEFLYEVLGAKRPPRAKSKSKTDKKSRAFVASQHPIFALFSDRVNNYSLEKKALSTYFSFRQWNSRLLYSLDPFGTDTGRFASRASAAWIGTQIQNQPVYAKEMYEPDDGYIAFEMDFSKAEAICTAYLSRCSALIKALCFPDLDNEGNKKDFYKVLGELFFHMEYETVTKEFRNKVLKKIVHGTNYMMGPETFIDNLDDIQTLFLAAKILGVVLTLNPKAPKEKTPKDFAKQLLDAYHIPFPEVQQWWESIFMEVLTTNKLINPITGHVRYFFGDPRRNKKIQRQAVAHQSQNFSVDNLNTGYLKAYQYMLSLEDPRILRLKTQIHDSLVGQVLVGYARQVIPVLKELLTPRVIVHGQEMVINVEVECFHTNWKDKEEWETFSRTTLPMLESQKSPIPSIAGRL